LPVKITAIQKKYYIKVIFNAKIYVSHTRAHTHTHFHVLPKLYAIYLKLIERHI